MNGEDRLRRLLHDAADDIAPGGDGLDRIRTRLAARRRRRAWLVPVVAAAAVVGIASVAVSLGDSDGGPSRTATHPTPAPTPTPSASRTVTTSAGGVPVWPVTTDAEAASAPSWANDPVQVVQHLLTDYLKLPATATLQDTSGNLAKVPVVAAGRTVAIVRLERVGGSASGPWSVTGAASEEVNVTAPAAEAAVRSPLTVTGTVRGYDQSVQLRLMGRTVLAEAHAAAGADRPWRQALTWSTTGWSVAALVADTYNGKGDLSSLVVVPVRRAADDTLVAVESGKVVQADATTGTTLRQLSYPPAGRSDSSPTSAGGDVAWVRTLPDGCTSLIIRTALAKGPATTVVGLKRVGRTLAALSPDGRRLAWVETACDGSGASTVVVRDPDGRLATVAATPSPVSALDVADDGRTVLQLADRVVVLPAGSRDFSRAVRLGAPAGCTAAAPAWDGAVAVAWTRCGDRQRLTRFPAKAAHPTPGPVLVGEPDIVASSVRGGQVLVSSSDGRIARLVGGRLVEIPGGNRLAEPSW